MAPLLKLNCIGDEAISSLIDILNESGLQTLVSFDSHQLRESASPAACPYHGISGCDCQVAIILVYDDDKVPEALLAHGQDGETWISLPTTWGQRPPVQLEKKIIKALVPLPG
jgi:hypothetical protein